MNILHLEDLPEDAEVVNHSLKSAGLPFDIHVVDCKDNFIKELKEYAPDLILSDHSLPSFDSHEALLITRAMGFEIPFILVTASVSEEYAVSIIKEGADDYVLKDKLERLPAAIDAAINKFNLKIKQRKEDELFRSTAGNYRQLFENNPIPMWIAGTSGCRVLAVNQAACDHYGYSQKEFLSLNEEQFCAHPNEAVSDHKRKDGSIIKIEVITLDIDYENEKACLVLARDVTERVNAERETKELQSMREKVMAETSIRVQERERKEIGNELHDNINQVLAAAKLYIDIALSNDCGESEALSKSQENITFAISEIRKLTHSLVAPSLTTITLIQAVEGLFAELRGNAAIRLEIFTSNYREDAIPQSINLLLYRIIQEQLTNIIKHAAAKNVTIELTATLHHIFLAIRDDGIGFDCKTHRDGLGLKNVANRVEAYDGNFGIISSPGQGCSIEISIPLRKEAELSVVA